MLNSRNTLLAARVDTSPELEVAQQYGISISPKPVTREPESQEEINIWPASLRLGMRLEKQYCHLAAIAILFNTDIL